MKTKERQNEILKTMNSFKKDTYHKTEVLGELLNYQSEVAKLTIGDIDQNLRLFDVVKHLQQENKNCGGIATESIDKFADDCQMITNLIKAEKSGYRGEKIAFSCLENLKCKHSIIKNVELANDTMRSEIDAVVLTKKGAFIIEVKNTSKDVFINEQGHFYREGKRLSFDSNLAEKMQVKETLLREVLRKTGHGSIRLFKIVVFTNYKVHVKNKCREFRTCFPGQLTHLIEDWNSTPYLINRDISEMTESINETSSMITYPLDFDTLAVKQNFATAVAELESAKNKPKTFSSYWFKNIYTFFNSKSPKVASAVAAIGVTVGTATEAIKHLNIQ